MAFIIEAFRGLGQRAEAKVEKAVDKVAPKVEKTVERASPFVIIGTSVGQAAGHALEAVHVLKSGVEDSSSSVLGGGAAAEALSVAGMAGLGVGVVANAWSLKESAKKVHRAVVGNDKESFGFYLGTQIPMAAAGAVAGSAKLTSSAMAAATGAAPAVLPILGSAGLAVQSVFLLFSGTYGMVRTCQFEGQLTNRVQYLPKNPQAGKAPRDPREVLFGMAFGKAAKENESPEELQERLKNKRDALIRNMGEDAYNEIARYFGVKLDDEGLPDESFDPSLNVLNFPEEGELEAVRAFIVECYDKQHIEPAASWLFEQAFGKEPEDGTLASPEERVLRFKIHRDRFIRLTSESCYETVAGALGVKLNEEGIPDAEEPLHLENNDQWRTSINRELISEVYRASFQNKVIQGLKIIVAVLCIAAAIALLVGTGGVGLMAAAAILLTITAIFQMVIRTEKIQETFGKSIWKRYKDYLMPQEAAQTA